jgi:hypothetical protein
VRQPGIQITAIAIACLTFFLPLASAVEQLSLDSEIGHHSKRIQRLYKEVKNTLRKAGDTRPILIEVTPSSGPQPYEGDLTETPNRFVIRVITGTPDYEDALLSHELFHIILNTRAFTGMAFTDHLSGYADKFGYDVNFCLSDDLIDRETRKRGFNPQLLQDLAMDWQRQALSQPLPANTVIDQKAMAVENFCFERRLSPELRRKFEKAARLKEGVPIVRSTRKLLSQFQGKQCVINDPENCYHLTLKLRDAAGYHDIISIRNRRTGEID